MLDRNGQRDSCGPRGIEEEDGTRPRRQLERGCQTSLRGNNTEKTDARGLRIHRQAARILKNNWVERSARDQKVAGKGEKKQRRIYSSIAVKRVTSEKADDAALSLKKEHSK